MGWEAKMGLDVKRRERLLESPKADAVMGPARRNASSAVGVASTRIGRRADRVNDTVEGSGRSLET